MTNLTFKPIAGFEANYLISNYGHIFSRPRIWIAANNCVRTHQGQFLKPAPNERGYLTCILNRNSIPHPFLVHRLVALHFVENPDPEKFDQVNHLRGNKLDNYYLHLEWTDNLHNMQHAFANKLNIPIDMTGKFNEDHHLSKPLIQLDKSGNKIAEWPSLKEVWRQLKFRPGNISRVCLGKRDFAYGYSWQYK